MWPSRYYYARALSIWSLAEDLLAIFCDFSVGLTSSANCAYALIGLETRANGKAEAEKCLARLKTNDHGNV
jgi:hypothetical protein